MHRWRRSESSPVEAAEELSRRLWAERDEVGSRFSTRPGFAILTGEGGSDPSGYDGDSGDASARVRSAFGEHLGPDDDLGMPVVTDATYGRGAAGWTAVVEWVLDAAGQGVVGLLVTAPLIVAAKRFRDLVHRLRQRGASFLVNRGGAALIALDDALSEAPSGAVLWVEAAEEIATVAGRPISELNHVGADTWLVLLVDHQNRTRYVRTIGPDGAILSRSRIPISELEAMYLPVPD